MFKERNIQNKNMRKIPKGFISSVLLILFLIIIPACETGENPTTVKYLYSIGERNGVSGQLSTDTFRIEKYVAPEGKLFEATCVFKSTGDSGYVSKVVGTGRILYEFYQTKGRADKIGYSQAFGFYDQDIKIEEITYQNLFSFLTLKKQASDFLVGLNESSFPDKYKLLTPPAFVQTVYVSYDAISIPTSNGKAYLRFQVK